MVRAAQFMDRYDSEKQLSVSAKAVKVVMMEPDHLSMNLK